MERTNNEGTIGVNMSLGHGIIFGGMQEREDNGDRRIHLESQKDEEKPVDSWPCLLYTSPSPRDKRQSRMPSSA